MMNPSLPPKDVVGAVPSGKAGGLAKPESSFAEHFDRQQNCANMKNLLGCGEVKSSETPNASVATPKSSVVTFSATGATLNPAASVADGKLEERQSLAELLGQLMNELKAVCKEDQLAPGEWVVPAVEGSLFNKIAETVGLDEMAMQDLLAGLNDGGNIELTVLLDVLATQFMEMANAVVVKVPDTELPFLESVLTRMGFGPEELAAAANMASSGDDLFDLGLYLEGLRKIATEMSGVEILPANLSDWEKEQFADLLTKAGVGKEVVDQILLPTKGQDATFSFDKLTDILAGSVAAVKDAGARIDLPGFVTELNDLLAISGYVGKEGGWTPVVQEAMENVYRDLMDSVDLKSVRIQWTEKTSPIAEESLNNVLPAEFVEAEDVLVTAASADLKNLGETDKKGTVGLAKAKPITVDDSSTEVATPGEFVEGEEALFTAVSDSMKDLGETDKKGNIGLAALTEGKSSVVTSGSGETMTVSAGASGENQNSIGPVNEVNRTASSPRTLSERQQQAFEQISRGVVTGLRNNDHHLVLKLYPPELGEVKVELMIKNDHVAVSFSMENSRVKEALEAGMGQFRQNLEQHGFSLGECMVSVGDGNESDDAWQRFANEWRHQMKGSTDRSGSFSDLPDNALYRREKYLGDHEGAISLLV